MKEPHKWQAIQDIHTCIAFEIIKEKEDCLKFHFNEEMDFHQSLLIKRMSWYILLGQQFIECPSEIRDESKSD